MTIVYVMDQNAFIVSAFLGLCGFVYIFENAKTRPKRGAEQI